MSQFESKSRNSKLFWNPNSKQAQDRYNLKNQPVENSIIVPTIIPSKFERRKAFRQRFIKSILLNFTQFK